MLTCTVRETPIKRYTNLCKQMTQILHLSIYHTCSFIGNPLSAVKAGSFFFFWRICTSVVNLAPALRSPLHLSDLNSITSPIILEAVGVIPYLLRSSCEVDCVTYSVSHVVAIASLSKCLYAWSTVERMPAMWQ